MSSILNLKQPLSKKINLLMPSQLYKKMKKTQVIKKKSAIVDVQVKLNENISAL
jgi:hypothetical protein